MVMPTNRTGGPDGSYFSATLSNGDFCRLSEFIHAHCGIKMPPAKRTMLEGRLKKRLHSLGIESFGEYCEYLLSPRGKETECVPMVDVVTTNKTDFFREPAHFDYLTQQALPELVHVRGTGVKSKLNVWSAGCSSGEEPYTLAMVLSEYAEQVVPLNFSVLATDISTRVLDKASRGIYEHERVEPVPPSMRTKYLLRSKNKDNALVRIAPELRSRVRFQRLNFMDDRFDIPERMTVVFCRNVLIYFDKPTQEEVLNRICRHLVPGGYLFTGHSEALHGLNLPLSSVAATIYRRL
jgi:chemotaxis protein methyltransferase CheR